MNIGLIPFSPLETAGVQPDPLWVKRIRLVQEAIEARKRAEEEEREKAVT